MGSTESKRVGRFFERKLVPAAEKLRARGVSFFPVAATTTEDSWYVDFPADLPEFVELEANGVEDALRTMWEHDALPELAALAKDLSKLARALEFDDEQSDEVSPFMYVMY